MIGILNLETSNLSSVTNAMNFINSRFLIIRTREDLKVVDKIILPGVGTFGDGIKSLHNQNLYDQIIEEVKKNKKPILGICLGLQMFFEESEESKNVKGLGLIDGSVKKLSQSDLYSIPRIGWASSKVRNNFLGLEKNQSVDFYYIHSYLVKPIDPNIIYVTTEEDIPSCIKSENIYGCQFHPEKSHVIGLNILKKFSLL